MIRIASYAYSYIIIRVNKDTPPLRNLISLDFFPEINYVLTCSLYIISPGVGF